jgi:hypothetical protein
MDRTSKKVKCVTCHVPSKSFRHETRDERETSDKEIREIDQKQKKFRIFDFVLEQSAFKRMMSVTVRLFGIGRHFRSFGRTDAVRIECVRRPNRIQIVVCQRSVGRPEVGGGHESIEVQIAGDVNVVVVTLESGQK